ncbi:MAG: hypothetical protein SGPRY_010227 [Prymnesium sp.]
MAALLLPRAFPVYDFIEVALSPAAGFCGSLDRTARSDATGLSLWTLEPGALSAREDEKKQSLHAIPLSEEELGRVPASEHVNAFFTHRGELEQSRLSVFLSYYASTKTPMVELLAQVKGDHAHLLHNSTPHAMHFREILRQAQSVGLLRVCLAYFEQEAKLKGSQSTLHSILLSMVEGFRTVPAAWPHVITVQSKWGSTQAYTLFRKELQRKGYYEVASADGLFVQFGEGGISGNQPGDLDFIEIGTSDFDTISGTAPLHVSGLAVEAIPIYFQRLKVLPRVTKLNAAVVGSGMHEGNVNMFFVDPMDIERHHLPYWVKGCNQVGLPHSEALNELRRKGLMHLMRNVSIPTLSFRHLIHAHAIHSVGLLKIDVEGQEGYILGDVVHLCQGSRSLCPRVIMFETTHMHVNTESKYHRLLVELGYVLATPTPTRRDRVYALALTLSNVKSQKGYASDGPFLLSTIREQSR